LQDFQSVAQRRLKEAEFLLSLPEHKFFDGAVTFALLSVECALKALILFYHGANTIENLPEPIQQRSFQGATGHKLFVLYEQLDHFASHFFTEEVEALRKLHQRNPDGPYRFRYGVARTIKQEAVPFIDKARKWVACMKRLCP
jgi:hypothetical protein